MADPGRLDELKRKFEENPRRYFAPLANEYRKAGEPDMAIELCRTYLPQQPSHMSGYIVYGQALHDAGRDEEAAAVFYQALALDPENIIALRQLGDIARRGGDGEAAIEWYRKVLELDPRNDEIASFITALESPGAPQQRSWSGPERSAPPPVRPEPEHDGSSVALEDLVSQPDAPRVTPTAPMPAYGRQEAPEAPEAPEAAEPGEEPEAAPEAGPAAPLPEAAEADEAAATRGTDATGESEEPGPAAPSLLEITFEAAAFEAVDWPTVAPAAESGSDLVAEQGTPEEFPEEQPAPEQSETEELAQSGEAEGAEGDYGEVVIRGEFVQEFVAETFVQPVEPASPVSSGEDEAAHELLRFSDYVPGEEPPTEIPVESMMSPGGLESELPAPEGAPREDEESPEAPAQGNAAASAAPGSGATTAAQPSPFVTETMAELYLQQGLRGEALAIYRQLAVSRDDPALRQRIAELEHTAAPAEAASEAGAEPPAQEPRQAGESVRAFFARIGAQQPDAHPRIAAESESGLASLFSTNAVEDSDIAAAQSLAGAFAAQGRSSAPRD